MELVHPGEELPREVDGVFLEVIAEGEVAQHLEERVVASGVADVLQVVVLAAGAQRALRRGGALGGTRLLAEEHVLELHHAGIDEEQRRVVRRHERARGTIWCPFERKYSRKPVRISLDFTLEFYFTAKPPGTPAGRPGESA